MVDKIEGGAQLLLSPEEAKLFEQQALAQQSGDVDKAEAEYQNEPKGGEQCSGCAMFVPGFEGDVGGYCTKVHSYRGPLGFIFPDGWCKYFESDSGDEDVTLESIEAELNGDDEDAETEDK